MRVLLGVASINGGCVVSMCDFHNGKIGRCSWRSEGLKDVLQVPRYVETMELGKLSRPRRSPNPWESWFLGGYHPLKMALIQVSGMEVSINGGTPKFKEIPINTTSLGNHQIL